jgi:hypothetical protein
MNVRAVLVLILALQLSGCAGGILGGFGSRSARGGEITPEQRTQEWVATMLNSQRAAELGQHAEADRILLEFSTRHDGSAEAVQAGYWRAVYALDPTNTAGSPGAAVELLDGYIASRHALTHRQEAVVLHRLATALDRLQITAGGKGTTATAGSTQPASPAARDAAREAELQKLRQELRETKEELERLRRRLAPAATPPPQ